MVDQLDRMFSFQEAALSLRSQRHQLLASNIANADTPNYKARDFNFKSALQKAMGQSGSDLPMARTSAAHLDASGALSGRGLTARGEAKYRTVQQPSIDGNTVDMDVERMNFAENTMRYEADLSILNAKIKSMMTVIQSN